jgi:asparagine synthetase B (glutamine-hydrolysing)
LIEAAARLAPEDVVGFGQTKSLLRRAMAADLPPEILHRKDKTAFAVPERRWVQGELREAVREAAREPFWKSLDVPGRAAMLRHAIAETEGRPHRREAWKVLTVARWHRVFF